MLKQLKSCMKILRNEKGATLIIFFLIMVVLSILFVSFMSRSIVDSRATRRNMDGLQASYLAEAGLDQVKKELYGEFEDYYYNADGTTPASDIQTTAAFAWFDSFPDAGKYVLPNGAGLTNVPGTYTVTITNVSPAGASVPKDVEILCTAQVNNITKTISAVIRFSMCPSKVFDFSYFVNNYGWFYSGGITSQGDIRSNGDFNFKGGPTVNGDIYASLNPDLGADGDISVIGNINNDTIPFYRNNADTTARPTNPSADPQDIDGDGILEEFPYENGYDGAIELLPAQQMLDLPFLGDLSYYQGLATSENGTIKQGGVTLVNNTLNGNIVLIGTDANPIEIDGPVVVSGDVLIRGKVRGQGTIYSGRNTHILGDLIYVNPPAWVKPDINPDGTDAVNETRDFIGLAAKGNIIIGDYTPIDGNDWLTSVDEYITTPFTQGYTVDESAATLGYDSDGDPNNGYWFDGDYLAFDGGTKTDGTDRKFYESSYDDAYFSSIADKSSSIRQIDGVMYTNHAFTGKVGEFTMNGSIVSRDEAIVFSGHITLNYDIRAKDEAASETFYLPRELALPHTQYLKFN